MILDRTRPATPVRWTVLLMILAAAVTARLWHLTAGVPYAVAIDEPQVVDRAIRILKTGDWNTHAFDYPSLVIYFHAAIAIVRFLWGAIDGEWASLDGFTVQAIYSTGRLAAALVGAATVWLTYKLGSELSSRDARLALLAAAQMAVRPMHVRESHYILTDVPMTALTVLALWLTLRAARVGTVRAFAWAGAMCGLAAAAKYTGGVAFAAVFVAWLVYERRSRDRARKLAAAVGAAAVAFLAGAPFTLLDLPAFLDGFAAQFARFAAPAHTIDPSWLLYAKHLWIDGPVALVFAVAGLVLVVARRSTRALWAPVLAFAAVYFYVLSTHSHVFGRYALPLLPVECLLSSAAVLELAALAHRVPALARPGARHVVLAGIVAVVLYGPITATVGWLDHLKRADTREIAADWLEKSVPKASRIAVENSGPSYLNAAGFQVLSTELLVDHDPDWYRERADYLVVSADDLTRYRDLLAAGTTVFEIAPTPQRWGPRVRIVQLANR